MGAKFNFWSSYAFKLGCNIEFYPGYLDIVPWGIFIEIGLVRWVIYVYIYDKE